MPSSVSGTIRRSCSEPADRITSSRLRRVLSRNCSAMRKFGQGRLRANDHQARSLPAPGLFQRRAGMGIQHANPPAFSTSSCTSRQDSPRRSKTHPLYIPAFRPAIADAEFYLRIHKSVQPITCQHNHLRRPCPAASDLGGLSLGPQEYLTPLPRNGPDTAAFRLPGDLSQSVPPLVESMPIAPNATPAPRPAVFMIDHRTSRTRPLDIPARISIHPSLPATLCRICSL